MESESIYSLEDGPEITTVAELEEEIEKIETQNYEAENDLIERLKVDGRDVGQSAKEVETILYDLKQKYGSLGPNVMEKALHDSHSEKVRDMIKFQAIMQSVYKNGKARGTLG
mmetsp:Transcript_32600/g.29455  ORF Transcript_32600/g.29455 Transcript_32600/m.29455 type:complete len:113 (+) Transcript_32600:897-1235(+)|eukprot:CAMPEP_0114589914 /NCGR_PEP_ID=MMETSP0125-20121206/12257_1 /TAXON_ID=485358 ORGANISM="Aristerostoma sp., Strain ATCC 50986" /NCGR_SAMPLE_ID=MMETSP0125 /ASSEMBLY_ACC=CAM_ASM_000245 /LENGTH=112 /DNA_ID=CAMNT_0001787067 /DNA_START=863 /DNA_END=1204 /DNA_ORIENTATION=+